MLLLKLKNWQLLALIFLVPLVLELTGLGNALLLNESEGLPVAIISTAANMIPSLVFLSWAWHVGTYLHKKLPAAVKMSLTVLKLVIIALAVYGIVFSMYSSLFWNYSEFSSWIGSHLLAMLGTMYILHFIAKSIKVVEMQKPLKLSDYSDEFLWLIIWPFGIWKLQPRINGLLSGSNLKPLEL
ncbi:hypothetical protein ACFS7Z_25095 [Pontibacter toksunensis]|uniref:Uncharacterized protein n=1 Tax=Pontibacter toksunensis TaxID=1332631 RepID=A0ABW6C335_9BACT